MLRREYRLRIHLATPGRVLQVAPQPAAAEKAPGAHCFFPLFAPLVALPAQWMEQGFFQVTDLVLSESPGIIVKSIRSISVESLAMD